MIAAIEALRLPTAKLSTEERARADKLEAEIDLHVRKNMERRGVDSGPRAGRNAGGCAVMVRRVSMLRV